MDPDEETRQVNTMPTPADSGVPKCNFCRKPAIANYQKVWVRYRIYKNGDYSKRFKDTGVDIEEPTDNDNIHVCRDHEESWLKGETIV